MFKFRNLATIALVVLVTGCATRPTTIATSYIAPARAQETTKLRRVAVIPFTQINNDDVTPNVELVLSEARLNGEPFYTVVERSKLDASFAELKLSSSGALDPKTAVRLGKIVGANGVYTGTVTKYSVTNQPYTESRSECAYYVTKSDKKGKQHQECGQMRNWDAQCDKLTATYAFIPKLIGVETAVIKYSKELSGTSESSACRDSSVGLKDKRQLLAEAKEKAINEFRTDVTPHIEILTLTLLENEQQIKSENYKTLFKQGIIFAKGSRLDRACDIWNSFDEPNSPDLLYNKGICSELLESNLARAMSLYQAADRLTSQPVQAIGAALVRIRTKQEDAIKLASQTQPASK